MAVVATAVAGFVTSLGVSSAVAAAVGSLAVNLLASVAISALATAFQSTPDVASPGIKTEQTQMGGTTPASFPMGVYATNGQLMAPPMSHGTSGGTPNAYLNYVIELSDLPGVTLEGLIINGERAEISQTVHPDYGTELGGPYAGKAWFKVYDGTQTAADPMLLAKYPAPYIRPWQADMVGNGIAYVVMTFLFDREVWNGFPRCRFEVGNLPLYDPRKDTTAGGSGSHRWNDRSTWEPSENNAVQAYNVFRGIQIGPDVWGGSYAAEDLPFDNWITAMNACDVDVDGEPKYRSSIEVYVNQKPLEVLEELGRAAAMEFAEVGGQWRVRVGGPGLPVYFFSDDDILISEGQRYEPFPSQVYRGVHASYPDPEAMWESREAPPRYADEWVPDDDIADLTLPAVPYPNQVQRLQLAYLREEERYRRHMISLPPDASILEPLDVAAWTSEKNGYTSKSFELAAITINPVHGICATSLREKDSSDFVPQPGDPIPTAAPSPGTVYAPPQVLPGFQLEAVAVIDASTNQVLPGLKISWNALEDMRGVAWEYLLNGGTQVFRGSVNDVSENYVTLTEGVLPGSTYAARCIPVIDRASEWTPYQTVTTLDLRPGFADLDPEVETSVNGLSSGLVTAQADIAAAQADIAANLASLQADDQAIIDTLTDVSQVAALGEGVLLDPFFGTYASGATSDRWVTWSNPPTSTPANEVYSQGKTLVFDVALGEQKGVVLLDDGWSGPKNAEAYVVEVIFTLVSGSLTGAGVLLDWDNSGAQVRVQHNLDAMIDQPIELGRVTRAAKVFKRGALSGTFTDHDVHVLANWSGFGDAAKNIKFHKCQVRPATAEELGSGEVNTAISAAVSVEAGVRATEDAALAAQITSLDSDFDSLSATVSQNYATLASADAAIASDVTNLNSSLGSLSATVTSQGTTLATVDGKVQAMSGMAATVTTIDGQQYISNIRLTSYADPDGSGGSAIQLLADATLFGSPTGQNFIRDASFIGRGEHVVLGGSSTVLSQSSVSMRAAGLTYAGTTYETLMLYQNSTSQDGYAEIGFRGTDETGALTTRVMSCKPDDYVEFSVQLSLHRVDAVLYIFWRDKDGVFLGASGAALVGGQSDSANPEIWPRYRVVGKAPANAAFADPRIRNNGTTSGSNSYIFVHKPQMCFTHGGSTAPQPWRPSGLTKITNGLIEAEAVNASNVNTASFAAAGLALFGDTLQSTNFVSGSAGWQINKDGSAEFANLVVRSWVQDGAVSEYSLSKIVAPDYYINENVAVVHATDLKIEEFWQISAYWEAWQPSTNSNDIYLEYRTRNGGVWTSWVQVHHHDLGLTTGTWLESSANTSLQGEYEDLQARIRITNGNPDSPAFRDTMRNVALVARALVK